MSKGNFSNYLEELCGLYNQFRDGGLDLYIINGESYDFLVALPDRERKINPKGDLRLHPQDLADLEVIFSDEEKMLKTIRSGGCSVQPYEIVYPHHKFDLEIMRRVLEGKPAILRESVVDLD